MQLFASSGPSEPGKPAASGCHPPGSRLQYGAGSLRQRNENGLLAVVERHRDAVHRNAVLPRPAAPDRG